jgi:hypothetical protein
VKSRQTSITILMADNHEDDSLLVREALAESQLSTELHIVRNGEERVDRLSVSPWVISRHE